MQSGSRERECRQYDAMGLRDTTSSKNNAPAAMNRGGVLRSMQLQRLRQDEADHHAAVAQTAFRGRVVADRVGRAAAFDGDARRVDAMAGHEVVLHGLGTGAVEVRIRSGVLTIVEVAD